VISVAAIIEGLETGNDFGARFEVSRADA